jgi:hypothetical protein
MTYHEHTADCIGGNELNELTCLHLSGDHLLNADRYVVTCAEGPTVNVFTDDSGDAILLARAAGYPSAEHARRDPQPDPYA